ncbi:hypothetical protein ES702_00743 [subsurface metagenome]
MRTSKDLKKHVDEESVFKKHRFNPKAPEVEEKQIIKFEHRVLQTSEAKPLNIFGHRPTPEPQKITPRIRDWGIPEKRVGKPSGPLPLLKGRRSLKEEWSEVLEKLQGRMPDTSIVPVGDEKVTVYCGYEPNKNYIATEYFTAISHLQLNEHSEIFITLDGHAAPSRWSDEGVTKEGQLERRERVVEIENMARAEALRNGSDYLMIVECDLLPPPAAYRRLRTLITAGADVAFLPYTWHWMNMKKGPNRKYAPVLAWRGKYPNLRPITLQRFLTEPYPTKVTTCGFGCVMFTKKVFKEPFELDPYSVWCTDGVFAKRVQEEHLTVLGDNRVLVQHVCCKRCNLTRRQGEPVQAVNVKDLLPTLFKDRTVTVKEI